MIISIKTLGILNMLVVAVMLFESIAKANIQGIATEPFQVENVVREKYML